MTSLADVWALVYTTVASHTHLSFFTHPRLHRHYLSNSRPHSTPRPNHLSIPDPGVQTQLSPPLPLLGTGHSILVQSSWPALSSPPNQSVTKACPVSLLTPLHLFHPFIPIATTHLNPQHLSPHTLPGPLSSLFAYKIPLCP